MDGCGSGPAMDAGIVMGPAVILIGAGLEK